MEVDIFKKGTGYANLVFLSCIDKARSKREIMKAWGLSVDSQILYKSRAKDEIDQLIEEGFLVKERNKLKSSFDGFSKLLKEHIKEKIEGREDSVAGIILKRIKENIQLVEDFFDKTWVRENIFSLENIKRAMREERKNCRDKDSFSGLFIFVLSFIAQRRVGEVLKDEIGGLVGAGLNILVSSFINISSSNFSVNIQPLKDSCEREFEKEEHKEDLKPFKDMIDPAIKSARGKIWG